MKGRRGRRGAEGHVVLHIGKTGGSYLRHVLYHQIEADRQTVRMLGHSYGLMQALKEFPRRKVVFTIREPLSLFISGFNSRLRKGQPRYDVEWSKTEALAFGVFQTPNALGEALSSSDAALQACAEFSLLSIKHVRSGLKDYLISDEILERQKHRIGYILEQSQLDADLQAYAKRLGLDTSKLDAKVDEVTRHATPQTFSRDLSELAAANLTRWFEADFRIYNWCLQNKSEINAAVSS